MTKDCEEVQAPVEAQDRAFDRWATWVKVAAGVASVLTTVTVCLAFWGQYGWVTQSAYAEEHTNHPTQAQMESIQILLAQIKASQDRNQAQWECDEIDEEIPEIEYQISREDNEARLLKLERELKKKEERWVDLNCTEFTD